MELNLNFQHLEMNQLKISKDKFMKRQVSQGKIKDFITQGTFWIAKRLYGIFKINISIYFKNILQ